MQQAGSLSGGEQQMLALARALAVPPRLIIADEMSLGLAPLVAEQVFQSLDVARQTGVTIVLIEQLSTAPSSWPTAASSSPEGRVGWSGPAVEAREEVLDRYLGEADQSAVAAP